jgi:hypothetical protein
VHSVVSHSLPYNCLLYPELDSVDEPVCFDNDAIVSPVFSSPLYGGIRSPVAELPPTPPASTPQTPRYSDAEKATPTARWKLAPRRTHSALTSGIRSLSDTHDVTIVAWPADLINGTTGEKMGNDAIEPAYREALEMGMKGRKGDALECVPVWLPDKVCLSPHFMRVSVPLG